MLYCPKCQKTYEDAVIRFCLNDGVRLLPSPSSGKSVNQKSGVFTNFIKAKTDVKTDKFSSAPAFSKVERNRFLKSNVQAPIIISEIFKPEPRIEAPIPEPIFEPIFESVVVVAEPAIEESLPEIVVEEPAPKIIFQSDVHSGTAQLDDENLKNRKALDWNNPQILVGQTVKGRYYVVEQIGEDEDNFTYLAEDKIVSNKKVVLRVLINEEDSGDAFSNRIFDEERVALTHVNHPNIANVLDSGTLPEGNPFVVSEFVEGKSVKDYLQQANQFDAQRTAKIIRQVSYALDEAHQNGILHRNLKPASIILTVNEKGAEEVKLTDFGTPRSGLNDENLPYKSPEQVAGKPANFASDEFSLAVIAYQMLTDQLPFKGKSVSNLLKAQRQGLKIKPTSLRSDLLPKVDESLQKALSFNPHERFPRVRGFADAFYNALTNTGLLEPKNAEEAEISNEILIPEPTAPLIAEVEEKSIVEVKEKAVDAPVVVEEKTFEPSETVDLPKVETKSNPDLAIDKHSLAKTANETPSSPLFAVLGVVILLLGLAAIWAFLLNRPNSIDPYVQKNSEIVDASEQSANNTTISNSNAVVTVEEAADAPPLPRSITPPADAVYFQNSKENFKGDAMRNFLGFSLYYPKDWKLKPISENLNLDSKTRSNFIDVSKDAATGTPIEQIMVSYYNSNGTFKADREIFAEQVAETNETLKKIIPNYEMVAEGASTINNGWRAYEMKFQGTGKTASGEKITLWGKRLFVPTAIRGMKNGYVITMLATSLSKEIKSVEDVGVKGQLPAVLETFEPNQNF
jgi:serine/threonine protein kinase